MKSITTTRVAAALISVASAVAVASTGAAPATAAPVDVPFQLQTFVLADLPTPRVTATVGAEPGVATLAAVNPTNAGAAAGVSVRWLSLSTGRTGFVSFPYPHSDPVRIEPGPGPVVADIEGGLWPGFGTFNVP